MRGKARKLYLVMGLALAAMFVAAGAVFAAVTFDPATGTGFVGKGDVQKAFGWNNKDLQANASGVSFTYNATETFDATCTWTTGEGTKGEKTHTKTKETSTAVSSAIAYDPRVKNQITGFNLTGLGEQTVSGDPIPVVGESCLGEGADGTYSSVTPTGSTGGLYANFGGTSVPLQ